MTVAQLYARFYVETGCPEDRFPPAILLILINEAELDFADKTLCLDGAVVSRYTMTNVRDYSLTGDKNQLDGDNGYQWTLSTGGGTNEYYCQLSGAGGDPSLDEPDSVHMDGVSLTEGTAGSLDDHEYDYGDNDTLGYDTVYIADASGDPDTTEVVILLEPGGFAMSNFLRPRHLTYDDADITDYEKSIEEIGLDDDNFSNFQHWAIDNGTMYFDPQPTGKYTVRLWPAIKPTAMTLTTQSPAIETQYHPHLLTYLKWKYFAGPGADPSKELKFQTEYLLACREVRDRTKLRRRTGNYQTRRVFP